MTTPGKWATTWHWAKTVVLATVAVGLVYAVFTESSGPKAGTMARDFDLPVVSGEGPRFRLADQAGTVVVVEVFASWCRACRAATPVLSEGARARRRSDVRFVAVSVDDSRQEALAAAREWGIPFDVTWDDGSFAKSYGISRLPTFVVVDRQGKVRASTTGRLSRAKLEGWLTSVGAERLN